jgi:xylan 1,4-beta-xylosidase
VYIIKIEDGKSTIVNKWRAKATNSMRLRVAFEGPEHVRFYFSTGGKFTYLGPQMSGLFLPPWDRAIRVGLLARGAKDQQVVFDSFTLKNK